MAQAATDEAGKQSPGMVGCAMATAILSIVVIAAEPAAAQINPYQQTIGQLGSDSDDTPVRSAARVPGVTGFPGRGLAVVASMNSRYETNLSRQQPTDDGARFLPQISANYGLGGNRLGLFAAGSYGRDIVRGNRLFQGGDRSSFSGGLDLALSRCTGEVGGSFRRSLNLRSDASQFGAFQQQTTTMGVAASCRIGNALTANAALSRSNDKNTGVASQALNADRLDYSAGLTFNANRLGQFSLGGAISDLTFPGRLVVTPTGVVEDGFKQRSLRFGVSRAFGNRITVALGASAIDNTPGTQSALIIVDGLPQIVDRTGFNGLGYDGTVGITLTPRLSLQFTADRNVNSSPFVGALLTVNNSYLASANAQIGRYNVSTGARFSTTRFQGGFVSEFDPTPRRSDRFQSYFINVGGRIGQRLRASVELNHSKRVSNPAVLSFTSTGAGLNLSVAFGRGSS